MPRRIRVVELIYRFGIESQGGAGIGRFCTELSRTLNKDRFEVAVCALGSLNTPFERDHIRLLNEEGIRAFPAAQWDEQKPYQSFWRAYQALRSEFSTRPVDILHSHSEFTDIAALFLKFGSISQTILRTVHYGYRYEWRKRPLRRLILTNLLYPLFFNKEIGVSQSTMDNLNQRWLSQLMKRRASCIYNAISLDRFAQVQIDKAEKKRSLGLPPDALVIGSIGRLSEQKGYTNLIEAAAGVVIQMPRAYFLIVGEGDLAEELKIQAQNSKAGSHILFTGPRSDVEELLACMDLFVSPSLWEGLPTVIMESMASGIPVVATDIPGTRELIQHGITGWLTPPASAQRLYETILQALASPSGRETAIRQSHKAVEKFSIQSVTRQYERLYLEALPNFD
ncbi:MAG: glycosyltransferase family 4 protein [Omnitrophica WOR_2 bacterium]